MDKSRYGRVVNKNYLQSCAKNDALSHYRGAVLSKTDSIEVKTSIKIEFQNTPFLLSFKKVKGLNKRFSCYDIFKYQDHLWKRLGYRERIFNTGVRLIYHFIDNRFFFGELFFSDASKVNIELVALSLIKKYTDHKTVPSKNFQITGKDAFIFFENTGINISIKYIFTGDESINRNLQTISEYSPFTKTETKNDLEELL
ncbi:MAG: hypothetical protein IH598_03330 [Bacteroidales bacterium]|nr:hypothetical protein [Bacteroidales bacterium]